MRVLFIPAATAGHYFPIVPLAWALRTAGHEVRVACQPSITDLVVKSGHIAVPVGETSDLTSLVAEADAAIQQRLGTLPMSFDALAAMDPETRKWYGTMRVTPHVRAAEAMAGDLVEFTQVWRPDVIVADPATMVAPLLAEVLGVPLVHHMWGPQEPSLTRLAGYGADVGRWPEDLRKLYDSFGAAKRSDYSPFSIVACPPSLQSEAVARRHAIRYVPYNGPAVLPGWLRAAGTGRPRVCVSWTTLAAIKLTTDQHPVSAIAAALIADLDVEVVVMVTSADLARIGPVPDRARVVTGLPLQAVIPTCVLSVNAGGAGSVLTAAVHGVPQVVAPPGPAHAFNGERVAAVGAGVCLDPDGIDVDDLTARVSTMLSDDRWSRAAAELKRENAAQPPVADAVRRLEEVAGAQ